MERGQSVERTRQRWQSALRSAQWRLNRVLWWQSSGGLLAVALCVLAVGFLAAREGFWPAAAAWVALPVVLLAVALVSCWRLRGAFFGRSHVVARAEDRLKLDGALWAAEAGLVEWPSPPDAAEKRDLKSVGPAQRAGWAVIAASGLLLAAAFMPTPPAETTLAVATQRPSAWEQVESWLEALESSEVVAQENLDGLRERLAALENLPPEEWFSHHGLESGDHLAEQTQAALDAFHSQLARVDAFLGQLSLGRGQVGSVNADAGSASEGLPGEQSGAWQHFALEGSSQPTAISGFGTEHQEQWAAALRDLEQGALTLNQELLDALRNLQPGTLPDLDAAELEQLREQLQRGLAATAACLGGGQAQPGGEGSGQQGTGGPGPGGGPAPLTFRNVPPLLNAELGSEIAGVPAVLGPLAEVIGVTAHNPDAGTPTAFQLDQSSAGATGASNSGVVWRQSLLPQEQELLRRVLD